MPVLYMLSSEGPPMCSAAFMVCCAGEPGGAWNQVPLLMRLSVSSLKRNPVDRQKAIGRLHHMLREAGLKARRSFGCRSKEAHAMPSCVVSGVPQTPQTRTHW